MAKAKSKRQKAYSDRRDHETCILNAMAAYNRREIRPDGKAKSLRDIAKEHRVDHNTLNRRRHGKPLLAEARESQQLLAAAQEKTVIEFLKQRGDRGMPLTLRALCDIAQNIIISQTPQGKPVHKVGKGWPSQFVDKYLDELSMYWSKPLDIKRGKAVNVKSNQAYWETIGPLLANTRPHNIYAMDETGQQLGYSTRQRVIGGKGKRVQHAQSDGNKEMITVIATICADGSVIPPSVIYKGVYLGPMASKWESCKGCVSGQIFWIDDAKSLPTYRIATSANGWTDNKLGVKYIKDFDRNTRGKAGGESRKLFVDAHKSHITEELLRYAMNNNIDVLTYPENATHVYQGLDATCFGILKTAYSRGKDEYRERTGEPVTKDTFLKVFGDIFLEVFTKRNIKAAFRVTGIHPYNPCVITPEMLAPSEETSTQGIFPLPQPPLVNEIMKAMFYPAPEPESTQTTPRCSISPEHSAVSPSNRNIDPILLTPRTRQACRIRETLEGGAMAALLPENDQFSSEDSTSVPDPFIPPLLPPVSEDSALFQVASDNQSKEVLVMQINGLQEALRQANANHTSSSRLLESQNTQLVIQNLHCKQLTMKIHHHEHKKRRSGKRVLLSDAIGRYLTGDRFQEALKKMQDREEVKKGLQEIKLSIRDLNAERRLWREKATAEKAQKRQDAMDQYEKEEEAYHNGETSVKPVKPKALPRPSTPEEYLVHQSYLLWEKATHERVLEQGGEDEQIGEE